MIKKFVHKFKQQNKALSILYLVIGVAYLVSLVFFTKSILSLAKIETGIRIIALVFLYLYLILYSFLGIVFLFSKRKKSLIVLLIFTSILFPILDVASFYIDKTYGIIDRVQKKKVKYTSYMISLRDTSEFNKIGIISSKDDPTGYVIPMEMIKEFNISGKTIEYDDYISMISELYDGEIDAMFVADSYVTMFNSYEKFANIENETKVVYQKTMELENADNVSYSTKDLTEPFTILLMGVDATGDGIASSSSFNGDTLMMITFNPKTLATTIFSIPRDTFVPIACRNNEENKINSAAYGGTSCVVNTIQNLTGINIDYYVKINFTGVVKLVDDLGGVYVDVPMDFCEQDSERRFGEHLICLKKGPQTLNGEQALALSRHRKTLLLGDFQRVQNQQLVVEAMVESLKSVRNLDDFYKILDDIINNVDTNMTTPQILSLYQVGKNMLLNKLGDDAKMSIQKTYLTGYDLTPYLPQTRYRTYTFQYYKQSLQEIVDAMKVNLELTKPSVIKTFSWSANEDYELHVAGKSYYNETRRELLPNFVGSNKSYVDSWNSTRNLEIKVVDITSGNPLFDASLPNGTIVKQEEHDGIIVDKLKTLTISVINRNGAPTITEPKKEESKKEENSKTDEVKESSEEETLPNFVGKSLSDFNKWKSSLKNVNITFNTNVLTPDEVLDISDVKSNIIYKQSVEAGTKLKDVTSFEVSYYQEPSED